MFLNEGVSVRCNVGCGQTPTVGWRNFDNSLSLKLASIPWLPGILSSCRVINRSQYEYMRFAQTHSLEYGDVTKGLPLQTGSVDVLYSSHMLEHLDGDEATLFLDEARRVLRLGGIIRLAVPDISKYVDAYVVSKDADAFIASTHLSQARPKTISDRVRLLLVGTRHHQWMYDGRSLSQLLLLRKFKDIRIQPPGKTMIENPGALDLHERFDESVYLEARKL